MYIDADTIIKAASLLGAIGALVAAIVSVYKVIESNKSRASSSTPFRRSRRLSAMACAARCRGLWSKGATGRARMRWTNWIST